VTSRGAGFRSGADLVRPCGSEAPARGRGRRPAHGVGRTGCARENQPASSRQPRAAFGARRDESNPQGAGTFALCRVHYAVRAARGCCASHRNVPCAARACARAACGRRTGRAVRAHLCAADGRLGLRAGVMSQPANAVPMEDERQITNILEAALLTAGEPVAPTQLGKLFDPPLDAETVRRLLHELAHAWGGRSVELVEVASGWRFQCVPSIQSYLDRLTPEKPPRYSRAVMETLAIVAYQQPVTRGDIEAIRGVAVSTNVVKSLEDRQWVEVVGHRETPGRPALYATTKAFLDDLGLTSLSELPSLADLDASPLLEIPDASHKAAEAQFALASPTLAPSADGVDATAESRAATDLGEPGAAAPPLLH